MSTKIFYRALGLIIEWPYGLVPFTTLIPTPPCSRIISSWGPGQIQPFAHQSRATSGLECPVLP
jgi:hypothetical protein